MKRVIKFSLLLILACVTNVYTQIQPPDIRFVNLEENWLYISKDTNFVKSPIDKWSSPYWGRSAWGIIQDNNSIYIKESVNSQSPYGGPEGCLLHKLDLNTGLPLWIYHNNTYVGNVYREYYSPESIYQLDNGNIQVVGYRAIDSIDFTHPIFFGFNGRPIKKVLDGETGELLNEICSQDTFRKYFNIPPNQSRVLTLGDGDIVNVSKSLIEENGELVKSIEIFDINDQMEIDTPFINSIKYNTGLDSSYYDFHMFFIKLNKDTMMVLFSKMDTVDNEKSPAELKLFWVDISEKSNISKIKEKDITDVIYYPQTPFNDAIIMWPTDNTIFVYQYAEESTIPWIKFYWLAWYDNDGNQMGKIDKVIDENSGKYYQHIYPIGVKDGIAYIAAQIVAKAYDILKLEPNSNQIEKIGQIRVENTEEITGIYLRDTEFLPHDEILVCFKILKNNELGNGTSFQYYYNFDMKDLGMLTQTEDLLFEELDISIKPNPSIDKISVETQEPFSGTLSLVDMYGRKVLNQSLTNITIQEIEVSHLKSGMYILIGINNEGKGFRKKVMIVNNNR